MANPEYFFGRTPENALLDPANPHILLNHLRCAAFEIPLLRSEENGLGEYAPAILDLLQERGHLQEVKGRWFYTRGDYPSAGFSLRNAGENVYTIIDMSATRGIMGTGPSPGAVDVEGAALQNVPRAPQSERSGRVIGTCDELSAFSQLHPQAIYMQDGETYFVDRLDLTEKAAYVHRADLDYYTQSISDNYIDAREADQSRLWRLSEVFFGECLVNDKMTMFKKIKFGSRDSLGFGTIDLPHTTLHTVAFWLIPEAAALAKVAQWGRVPADGLQGIANVLLDVVSLYTMCDPLDLGAVVELKGPAGPTLYIYDKYPGGLGYAQRAYHLCEEIMQSALKLIQGCGCEDGCPSCVGSPILPRLSQDPDVIMKGRIPDKEASLILLHALLELPDHEPRFPPSPAQSSRARALLAASSAPSPADADGGGRAGAIAPRNGGRTARSRPREGAAASNTMETRIPRVVRPLPPDLRKKLEGQLDRLAEQARPLRARNALERRSDEHEHDPAGD
jgi:ATP-dependent helicase YprA (DUF1998 family)